MRKIFYAAAMVCVAVLAFWLAGQSLAVLAAPSQQAGVDISVSQVVASGFSIPVQVTNAGDGSGRLFVVEQSGRIKIIKNGTVLPTPFLDVSSISLSPADGSGNNERGLLSVAFHPQYESNGFFYINYTNNSGNTVVARYSVSANPDVADAGSAVTLFTVNQPYSNHNGGQLMFGPDGYLYIGMGDGGSGGDPQNYAQNKASLLGAMLRIDVNSGPGSASDCGGASRPYTIPATNPYQDGSGGNCGEIWAIGLRNPWRFSFDRLTDDMYIGDVGQNAWEEISYQAAGTPGGVNFGWRCKEGTHTYNTSGNACTGLTDPITDYPHNGSGGFSVTGGFVYRGNEFPALVGRYFYADFSVGRIWSLTKSGGGWSTPDLEISSTGFNISSFGEDEQGELYVVDYSGGTIRRLVDANAAGPNLSTSAKSASTPRADPGEVLTYTLTLNNTGSRPNTALYLKDVVPSGLQYVPGSLSATTGVVTDSTAPQLYWQGTAATPAITITYRVTATGAITGAIINQAVITGAGISPLTLTESIIVPRPTISSTVHDFFLPGTQPNQLTAAIPASSGCDFCHTDPIYNRWRGSLMSQAGRDPLFWAALAVANNDAPNAGDFCLRCHTPKGWLEGRSHPATGSALQSGDLSDGIACEVCHRMVDPVPSAGDEAVTIDAGIRAALTTTLPADNIGSAMLIIDPEDRRRGPFSLNPPHPNPTYKTDFLGQNTNAVTESRLCGTCHNIDNPLLSWDAGRGQFWPNSMDVAAPDFGKGKLFPIERTYDEWLNSQFATGGVVLPKFAGAKPGGVVASCQDCHMPRAIGKAAEDIYNPVNRDCVTTGCLPEHTLVGGNTWVPQLLQDTRWRLNSVADAALLNAASNAARQMLQKAATVTVSLADAGANKMATVRVTNDTGHKLPTGYPEGRRMWLNLKAYNAAGALIYESGAYNAATGQLAIDPDLKVYEVKQGLTPELASLVQLPAGESFHFVLNNTIVKDNRIPPRGYQKSKFAAIGLRPEPDPNLYADGQYWDDTAYTLPGNTARVTAVLYYQTSSKAYIDFLRTNGGSDGAALGQLWDDSKSPPEVMAVGFVNPLLYYFPVMMK